MYNTVTYGIVQKDNSIDYKDIELKALEHKPAMIIAGFSAYSGTIDRKRFSDIADKVAKKHGYRPILMADIAHIAGLIATGLVDGPWKFFDVVTTTTHKTLRGPRGGLIYYKQLKTQNSKLKIDL